MTKVPWGLTLSPMRFSPFRVLSHAQGQVQCPLLALLARDATPTMSCLISTFSSVINGDPGLASVDLVSYLACYPICLAAVKGGAFDQPAPFSVSGTCFPVQCLQTHFIKASKSSWEITHVPQHTPKQLPKAQAKSNYISRQGRPGVRGAESGNLGPPQGLSVWSAQR